VPASSLCNGRRSGDQCLQPLELPDVFAPFTPPAFKPFLPPPRMLGKAFAFIKEPWKIYEK